MRTSVSSSMIRILLLCLCLLLCFTQASAELPSLSFREAGLSYGQKLPVYSYPSMSGWRGAKGKASVSTNDYVFFAGWDGDWMLVMYETSNDKMRVGYVDSEGVWGSLPQGKQLNFAFAEVKTVRKTTMTDDPNRASSSIVSFKKGSTVTYLANYGGWAYIETTVKKKPARGFVKLEDLALDGVEVLYADEDWSDDEVYDDDDTYDDDVYDDTDESTDDDTLNTEFTESDPSVIPFEELPDPAVDPADDPAAEMPVEPTAPDTDQPQASADQPEASDSNGDRPAQNTDQGPEPTRMPTGTGTAVDDTAQATREPVQQDDTWMEDGILYTREEVAPVTVPAPVEPKKGPSGQGESVYTDVGADWYGVTYLLQDDNVTLSAYETDSRGYLKNVESGYVRTNYISTCNFGCDRTIRLYELPNGDLMSEYYESTSVDHDYYPIVLAYWHILRPNGKGFTNLMNVEYNASRRIVKMTDLRAGYRLTIDFSVAYRDGLAPDSTEWLNAQLMQFFADWGLKFGSDSTLDMEHSTYWEGKYVTIISSAMNPNGSTRILYLKNANKLPSVTDLRAEAEAHFIAPERSEEDILARLQQEMAAAGNPLTQTSVYDWNNLHCTAYTTSDGLTVTFMQESDGRVSSVKLDDTKLYTFRICRSAKDLGKLQTTDAMRRGWKAVTACPSLGLTDAAGMAAFDLQWNQEETNPGQFYVFAQHSAGNATAELRRTYQRAGSESISSSLKLEIN